MSTTLAIVVGCGILCAFACFLVAELIGSDVDWRHPDEPAPPEDDEPELQRHR